jgi:NAD+ synthase
MTTFLEGWIKEELDASSADGGIVCLNGGIDSATVAELLRRTCGRANMLALIMPCHNPPEDERLARQLAIELDLPVKKVDLTEIYDNLLKGIEASCGELTDEARAGLIPRLRMSTLYSVARNKNFLVFGDGNKDDLYCGRFTKYGDVGVDMLPLGDLLAGEVTALAQYLGIPDEIIDRSRSGGDEVGDRVSYDDLDRFIATGHAEENMANRIKEAYENSQHKRNPVPIAAMPRDYR